MYVEVAALTHSFEGNRLGQVHWLERGKIRRWFKREGEPD